jgi:hypothetical protein
MLYTSELNKTKKGGFTIDHVTFKNIHSEGHKYTDDFFCTADQPCKDMTMEYGGHHVRGL